MNIKAVVFTAVFFSMIAFSGPAFAQVTAPPMPQATPNLMLRSEHAAHAAHGSKNTIRAVHRRLERIIDQLKHDKRDFGGHRLKAIALLQQARTELAQALQYEKAHPGL